MLGMPLMVSIIGGEPHRFRPLVDLYRQAWMKSGHDPKKMKIGVHALGYVADTDKQAADDFFPGYAKAFTEIGRERGWPPVTRAQFDALLGPTGALIVGDTPAWRLDPMPYGGVKDSGLGREGIRSAIEEMTEPRMLVMSGLS